MADANTATAAGSAAASDDGGSSSGRTYTEAEVKALEEAWKKRTERAVKDRLKDKPELDEVEAERAKLAKRVEELEDAQRTEVEKLTRRLSKIEAEAKTREAELLKQVESETASHKTTRIRHALLGTVASKKLLEPDIVANALADQFTVSKDGRVVSLTDDGSERTVEAVVDAWTKDHPTFVPAPPGGSGSPTARGTGASAKPDTSNMSAAELMRIGLEKRMGAGWGKMGTPPQGPGK